MRSILKRTIVGLLAVMIAMGCAFVQTLAVNDDQSGTDVITGTDTDVSANMLLNDGQMNLDVVFVLDSSGSMLRSDPKKIAIDAYSLFVDLLDDSCGIGYVVFTHELKAEGSIVDTADKEALEATKKNNVVFEV